ncbi:hypothetical protein, partial [Stenotrophomonas sp.]|uniref:hypothetical protein n=1 Tax=Stenotrophomonas sp. TaxID=69392 RepID=UPI0028A92930
TLQVRPCKLGRRIHAAHAPAQPTRPALDRFLCAPATKDKRKIQKQTPVAALVMPDFLLLLCFPVAGQRPALPGGIHAWRGSTGHRETVGGGVAQVAGA